MVYCTINIDFYSGIFISVSAFNDFCHSIHSERRRICLGKSMQTLQNDTIIISWLFSFRVIQPTVQWYTLKLLCLFSLLSFILKTFRGSWLLKYLINTQRTRMTFSYKIHVKTFTWPNMSFYIYCISHIDASNKGIERACFPASCDIHISPFSII